MSDLTQDQVVDYLSGLTVLQVKELTDTLEEKWGVSAAAPVAVAAAEVAAAVRERRLPREERPRPLDLAGPGAADAARARPGRGV